MKAAPLALAGSLLLLPLPAQSATNGAIAGDGTSTSRLLVLNKAAGTVSLFDPSTRKEIAKAEVGTGPHEVAVSPDGRTAVVCNYGDQRPGNSLSIVDVPAGATTVTFALQGDEDDAGGRRTRSYLRPHGIQFLPDGRHVVVTSEQQRRLLVIDVHERKVVRALPTPQPQLHMIALAPDAQTAFGASLRDGTCGIFVLGTGTRGAGTDATDAPLALAVTVPTGAGAEGIAVAPGTGEVWVANRAADTLSIVDPIARKVVAELATAALPIRVAFTPDGARALVSCADAGQVQVFDGKTRQLVHTIDLLGDKTELSPLPIGICIEPDGRLAWIACSRGEFLAVVDLATFTLIDRVPAGPGPDGMAFARWTAAAVK